MPGGITAEIPDPVARFRARFGRPQGPQATGGPGSEKRNGRKARLPSWRWRAGSREISRAMDCSMLFAFGFSTSPGSLTLSQEVGITRGPKPASRMQGFMIALRIFRPSAGGNRERGPQDAAGAGGGPC